jgi:hypothetical protein
VSGIALDARQEEELYVILKPLEKDLVAPLVTLLRRVEQALFQRLTIEELERLAARFR